MPCVGISALSEQPKCPTCITFLFLSSQVWECISRERCPDTQEAYKNCKVEHFLDRSATTWGLKGNRVVLTVSEVTVLTLCGRTGEFADCLVKRTGVPTDLALINHLYVQPLYAAA